MGVRTFINSFTGKDEKISYKGTGRIPKHIYQNLSKEDKEGIKKERAKITKAKNTRKKETALINKIATATAKKINTRRPRQKKKRKSKYYR